MSGKCQEKGCHRFAEFVPRINVPAQGWSVEMHQPLSVIMSLKLCEKHIDGLKAADFLRVGEEKGMARIFEIAAAGKQPPDFDRAWISKVRLTSDEWKTFECMAAKSKADG